MTGAAEIRVAGPRDEMFIGTVVVDGQWCHATGAWRTRREAGNSEERWSEPRSYSWRGSEVLEIRWQETAG
jgi:hypothetical protein